MSMDELNPMAMGVSGYLSQTGHVAGRMNATAHVATETMNTGLRQPRKSVYESLIRASGRER